MRSSMVLISFWVESLWWYAFWNILFPCYCYQFTVHFILRWCILKYGVLFSWSMLHSLKCFSISRLPLYVNYFWIIMYLICEFKVSFAKPVSSYRVVMSSLKLPTHSFYVELSLLPASLQESYVTFLAWNITWSQHWFSVHNKVLLLFELWRIFLN